MPLFSKKETKAQIAADAPSAAKAAASGSGYSSNLQGPSMVGQYYTYIEGQARNAAMSVPTLARGRDLMASVMASTPLCMYREIWSEDERETEEEKLAPRSWLKQPDPSIPYSTLMAWTLDDLFFYGRAFWYISSRTQDGFPATFTRLPAASVTTQDQAGPVWFAPSNQVYFQGGMMDPKDLVQFISPVQGIVYQSTNAVQTALKLEASRYRNAESSIPSGVLRQTGGEPLSAQELADLSAAFNAARRENQTAALNEYLEYQETKALPDNMLMIESANYQALEMCRLGNIPPYLAGVNIGSYSYQNARSAREDLYIFGARMYMECVAQTLSMNNVLPRGTFVRFEIEKYLAGMVDDEHIQEDGTQIQQPDMSPDDMEENTQEEMA